MSALSTIFTVVRTAIKVIGFIDGVIEEHEREVAKEQAAKAAARKNMSDISNFAANNINKGEHNGR